MNAHGVGRGGDLVAESLFTEHLSELGQELQMLFGRLLRHQQHEHLLDGLAVGSIERNRLQRSNKRSERSRKALDPTVRNGNALTQAGRPETLSREQAVEDDRARDLRVVLEQLADLLE